MAVVYLLLLCLGRRAPLISVVARRYQTWRRLLVLLPRFLKGGAPLVRCPPFCRECLVLRRLLQPPPWPRRLPQTPPSGSLLLHSMLGMSCYTAVPTVVLAVTRSGALVTLWSFAGVAGETLMLMEGSLMTFPMG